MVSSRGNYGRPRPGTLTNKQLKETLLPLIDELAEDVEWYEAQYGGPLTRLARMEAGLRDRYLRRGGIDPNDFYADWLRWQGAEETCKGGGMLKAYLGLRKL